MSKLMRNLYEKKTSLKNNYLIKAKVYFESKHIFVVVIENTRKWVSNKSNKKGKPKIWKLLFVIREKLITNLHYFFNNYNTKVYYLPMTFINEHLNVNCNIKTNSP